jgi:hypothetical protein
MDGSPPRSKRWALNYRADDVYVCESDGDECVTMMMMM